jgi:hypothetical protein
MAKCRLMLGLNDGTSKEIFPKQDYWKANDPDFCGSWFALPYLGENWPGAVAEQCSRNEMGHAMLIEQYLNRYEDLQVSTDEMEAILTQNTRKSGSGSGAVWSDNLTDEEFLAGAPPCIQNMRSSQVNHGERNICMTHCSAFARKKYPDHVQGTLDRLNGMLMADRLPEEKVSKLAARARDKEIGNGYMCKVDTLEGYCDKSACKKVKYGAFSNGDADQIDEPIVMSVDEMEGENRTAFVTINGQVFKMLAADLMCYAKGRQGGDGSKWVRY